MGAIANTSTTLASAVADDGTVVVAYPAGQTQATLNGSTGGQVMVGQDGPYLDGVADNIDLTFGASNITITNRTGAAWAVGTEITASFGDADIDGSYNPAIRVAPVAELTAETGTASDTIADVGASFTQATLNNNFKSLADKVNAIIDVLDDGGFTR